MEDSGSSLRPRSLPLQRETDVIIAKVWLGSVGRRAAVIVAVGAHRVNGPHALKLLEFQRRLGAIGIGRSCGTGGAVGIFCFLRTKTSAASGAGQPIRRAVLSSRVASRSYSSAKAAGFPAASA